MFADNYHFPRAEVQLFADNYHFPRAEAQLFADNYHFPHAEVKLFADNYHFPRAEGNPVFPLYPNDTDKIAGLFYKNTSRPYLFSKNNVTLKLYKDSDEKIKLW